MYQEPMKHHDLLLVSNLLRQKPHGAARLTGCTEGPLLRGVIRLYPMPRGILLAAEISGLPKGIFFNLDIEGESPLFPLVSVRGRVLQVMVVGDCTVEDLMGKEVILSCPESQRVLARGCVCP